MRNFGGTWRALQFAVPGSSCEARSRRRNTIPQVLGARVVRSRTFVVGSVSLASFSSTEGRRIMSAGSRRSTPYSSLGPAGAVSSQAPASSQNPDRTSRGQQGATVVKPGLNKQRTSEKRFCSGSWARAIRALVPVGSSSGPQPVNKAKPRLLTSSVCHARVRALEHAHAKCDHLLVRIDTLAHVGSDAYVTLADPTGGGLVGTLHAAVLEEHRAALQPGATLYLRNVTALSHVEQKVTGFRPSAVDAVHLSVHLSNVEAIFGICGSEDEKSAAVIEQRSLLEAYVESVRTPPARAHGNRNVLANQMFGNGPPRRPKPRPLGSSGVYNSRNANGFAQKPLSAPNRPAARALPVRSPAKRSAPAHVNMPVPQRPRPDRPVVPNPTPQGRPRYAGLHRPAQLQQRANSTNSVRTGRPNVPSTQAVVAQQISIGSDRRPEPATQTNAMAAVESMSEDQLDNILGEVDLDAVISASGFSQALTQPSTQPPSAYKSPKPQARPQDSAQVLSRAPAPSPAQGPTPRHGQPGQASITPNARPANPDPVADPGSTPEKDTSVTPVEYSDRRPANDARQSQRDGPSPPEDANPLSAVDDEMIDSLLNGLDGDDFTDI